MKRILLPVLIMLFASVIISAYAKNEKRKRPNYTKEFKKGAVKLVVEQRYSCPEVDRRLGVAASNVTRWVRQYRQDEQDLSESGITRKELEVENRRLKKENKRFESEWLSYYRFVTRRSTEMQVLDYISYYNSIRLHSTLGYKTPFAYEKELCRKAA